MIIPNTQSAKTFLYINIILGLLLKGWDSRTLKFDLNICYIFIYYIFNNTYI